MGDLNPTEYSHICERLLQLEVNNELFSVEIEGFPIWERIRSDVKRKILLDEKVTGRTHITPGSRLEDYLSGIWGLVRNIFIKNPYTAPNIDLLIAGSPRRKKMNDELWWDNLCDPWITELSNDYCYFEKPYLNNHLTPAKTDNIKYLDLIEYIGFIRRKIESSLNPPNISNNNRLDEINEILRREFDSDIDVYEFVTDEVLLRRSTKRLYRKLLEKTNPDLVFLVTGHDTKKILVEASKDRGIPVVELQHGAIHRYHFAYSYPENREKQNFADYFFSFGEFWEQSTELPLDPECVYNVGYPFLENHMDTSPNIPQKENQMVVISQSHIGAELSKFAVELDELINDFHIVYKLHPHECENDRWKTDYPWLRQSDIEIVEQGGKDLYSLFDESFAQVGVSSTALYEGTQFGLKTFLVNLPGIEIMSYLIKKKMAYMVQNPSDIPEMVEAIGYPTASETDYIFKDNSINNIKSAIDDILEIEGY